MHPGPATALTDNAMTPAQRRTLLLLTVAAIAVRVAFLLLEPATGPVGDERTWTNWARELASPRVAFSPLRTHIIFYPPLYKYFLAVPFALTGSFAAARWAQLLVGSLLVPAVGLVGSRTFGARAGLVAAGIAAFYPELVWFAVHFWSETLFMTLLWWGMERLLEADARGRAGTAAVAGVLWGLAVLTRETVLYFLPFAAIWLAIRSGREGARARATAFFLAALLTVAPWTWRNWVVFHAFVPVSTAGGQNLFQGNTSIPRDETYVMVDAVEGRIAQYHYAMGMGLAAIRDRQPWWIFEKLRDEMPHFWEADSLALIHIKRGAYGEVSPVVASVVAVVVLLPYVAMMAGLAAGLAGLRPSRPAVLLVVFLVFYNALHIVTHGFARYRLPVMPAVFLLAASAWCARGEAPMPWRRDESPVSLGQARLGGERRLAALVLAMVAILVLWPSIRINLHHPAFGIWDGDAPPSEQAPPP